jgi:hypothetical protein
MEKPEQNSSTFILRLALLQEDCNIIDEQGDHVVLTIRISKATIRKNYGMLMALSEICAA